MKNILIMLFLVAALALPVTAVHAYVIDRIVAVVDGQVITKSELDRAVEVEGLRRGSEAKAPQNALEKEALESLIDRALLLGEARKFNIVDVTDEEVDKAFESVKARFASAEEFEKALRDEEITPGDLREDLKDQILAVKYVDRRVKFFVRVTLDDQKKYYEENKGLFGVKDFADVQEEIQSLLMEKETDRKLSEYLKELRGRADIVMKGGY